MSTDNRIPYAEFGQKLLELRKTAKMTRQQLGEQCGVAPSTIINYERGLRIPYADTAVKMAQIFGLTVEELLDMDNPELEMAQAEAMDTMRSITGKKGADRLQHLYAEAEHLAGGNLSDEQLLEFSMEMQKMAMKAQQRLTERFTAKRFQESVQSKAEKTEQAVRAVDQAIADMTGEHSF